MHTVLSSFSSGTHMFCKLYIHSSTVECSHEYYFAIKDKEYRKVKSQRFFKIKTFLLDFIAFVLCANICTSVCACGMCMYYACLWCMYAAELACGSQSTCRNWFLSFSHVALRIWTQYIRLGSRHLSLLKYFECPGFLLLIIFDKGKLKWEGK